MKKFFRDINNLLSFALALGPAILLYIFQPSKPIPYAVFAISVLLSMLCLWVAAKIRLDFSDISNIPQLKVLTIKNDRILCDPKGLLIHRSLVSLFLETDGIEKFIAYGYVEIINSHGLAQIRLLQSTDCNLVFDNVFEYSRYVIRPTITVDVVSEISSLTEEVSL